MSAQVADDTQKEERPIQETHGSAAERTVVGWQGIRCVLPPDWNVTAFSMEHDRGNLRIDPPVSKSLTVQIRWESAAGQNSGATTLATLVGSKIGRFLKRPEPPVPKPDLKANLEKILKETAKQAKKSGSAFESNIRPEKTEGEKGERTAINFSWSGAGRGQGKIWYCSECHRIIIAQVVGMQKDQRAVSAIASQLFATLQDHAPDGYDLWALYDLQVSIPNDFRLEEQKLLSGYLRLSFGRNGEKIVLDRWGLANITLKKFTLSEWFRTKAALVKLKRLPETTVETEMGHEAHTYAGPLALTGRLLAIRESKGSLRRFPTRYEGGIWQCPESNKLFALQVIHSKKTEGLWKEIARRCLCHAPAEKGAE